MADDQYLTEKHYLVCDKGVTPKQMKVTSQKFTKIGGHLAATEKDTLLDNNFLCVGGLMFAAGLAAGVCACIPGPGWIVAAAIAVALVAVAAIGYIKCKSNAPTRIWQDTSPVLQIDGKNALLLSSTMMCPKEGGTITPKETFWAAWGTQSLTNLGHIANFAYGFLAGKGIGSIATTGIKEGAKAAGKEFLNTAKNELIEQFTFKGWKNAGGFCRTMRGLGVGGAYYEQYNIWSSDKSILEKLQESGTGLIMGIFAAKGATTVCFPAGTIVHTANGLRNIEDLQVGDWVLTYNEQTAEQEYQPILVKHQRYTQQMMSIELPTGEVLQVTPEHRFYHNGEWIEAHSLKVGDLLHLKNGDYTSIIAIEILPNYQKVFNFDIQKNENYYVSLDGILVHNGYGNTPEWKKHENNVSNDLGTSGKQVTLVVEGIDEAGAPFKKKIRIDNLQKVGKTKKYQLIDAKYSSINDLTKATENQLRNTFTENQKTVYDAIGQGRVSSVTPVGKNALKAGLVPNEPIRIKPKVNIAVNNPNGGITYIGYP